MSKSFFKPWVGPKYYQEGFNQKRLLILGESHYCDEELCVDCGKIENTRCASFTIDTVKKYLDYKNGRGPHESWMNTFTKFTNVMLGSDNSKENIEQFWNSIMFYNYVQKALTGSRKDPLKADFESSFEPFIEVLTDYKPDLVIVWGLRLWDSIPDKGEWGPDISKGKYWKIYYFNIANKKIPLLCIYHPSTSYFTDDARDYIEAAISMA